MAADPNLRQAKSSPTPDEIEKYVERMREKYSVGSFAGIISVVIPRELLSGADVVSCTTRLLNRPGEEDAGQTLRSSLLRPEIEAEILRAFLIGTTSETLQPLKWRIEQTRRALLGELMEITHRSQPLLQAEAPEVEAELIRGVNEAQLRGYIMLISAKLPIIVNVRRYLDDAVAQLTALNEKLGEEEHIVQRRYKVWVSQLEGINDNVKELDSAVAQARLDRLLYEEEQLRAEQEMGAEIARVRDRLGISAGGGQGSDTPLFIVANFISFTLLALTLLEKEKAFETLNRAVASWTAYFGSWSGFIRLLILMALATGAFGLLLFIVHRVIKGLHKLSRAVHDRVFGRLHSNNYELDAQLDVPIEKEDVYSLSEGRFDDLLRARIKEGNVRNIEDSTTTEPMMSGPIRTSYRVERVSEGEALHRIHVETALALGRGWRRWVRMWRGRMPLYLAYEILYHRPSEAQRWVLKELRVIGTYSRRLSDAELDRLKNVIIRRFINILIASNQAHHRLNPHQDSLVTIYRRAS